MNKIKEKGDVLVVKVFWTQGCQPCNRTKTWLTSKGIDFEAVELKTAEDFEQNVGSLGYKTVPVAVTEKGTWNFAHGLPKLKELLDK